MTADLHGLDNQSSQMPFTRLPLQAAVWPLRVLSCCCNTDGLETNVTASMDEINSNTVLASNVFPLTHHPGCCHVDGLLKNKLKETCTC
jgi:hypothetical protein